MADESQQAQGQPQGSTPSSSVPAGWNQKNPAIRRIMADIRELARDPSDQYAAKPVEENMFEWHFAIRGPKGTDFEGGKYHGKILLPAEYPFKPPNIVFLTPTGRWETKTKICLSMSAYHPEDWQPAWGIRTMLEALISFMPSPSDGALGAVDCLPEQRRRLALESQSYTHPLMPPLPEEGSCSYKPSQESADAISQMRFQAPKEAEATKQQEEAYSAGAEPPQTPASPSPDRPIGQAVTPPARAQEEPAVAPQQPQQQPQLEPPRVVVSNRTNQTLVDLPPDRVDNVLKMLLCIVLLTMFALTYRKLLITFAPEL